MTNQRAFLSPIIITLAAVIGCGGQVLDVGETEPQSDAGASSVGGANNSAGKTSSEPNEGGGGANNSAGKTGSEPNGGGGGSLPSSSGGAAGFAAGGTEAVGGWGNPDEPELEPVQVIGGTDDAPEGTYQDLTLVGAELDDYEGKVATVRLGRAADRAWERLGSGQVRIVDGMFRLEFEMAVEPDLYKQKLVYIDVNDDGICTPDVDPVYGDSAAFPPVVMYVGPEPVDGSNMSKSLATAQSCAVFNGPWPTE